MSGSIYAPAAKPELSAHTICATQVMGTNLLDRRRTGNGQTSQELQETCLPMPLLAAKFFVYACGLSFFNRTSEIVGNHADFEAYVAGFYACNHYPPGGVSFWWKIL